MTAPFAGRPLTITQFGQLAQHRAPGILAGLSQSAFPKAGFSLTVRSGQSLIANGTAFEAANRAPYSYR